MNFKNIISKSSRGSSSSSKSSNQTEEIIRLQNEIASLSQNVSSLKDLLESRDSAIGSLAREKEKLYVELKSLQRSNKQLQQQLLHEREIHTTDKKDLDDNMKQLAMKCSTNEISNKQTNVDKQCICAFQKEIMSKDEVIFTLCSKYLKLKKNKSRLQNKYETLQKKCGEVCQSVIKVLKNNKKYLNSFLNELAKTPTSLSLDKYKINLVKVNNDLQFENTQLKLYRVWKLCLGESSKPEESDIAGPSNVVHDCILNEEEPEIIRVKNTYQSITNLKNCNKTIFFNKSISDSDLHRDFYR